MVGEDMKMEKVKYIFKIANVIIAMVLFTILLSMILGEAIDKEIEIQNNQALEWIIEKNQDFNN